MVITDCRVRTPVRTVRVSHMEVIYMKDNYDFSGAIKNPFAGRIKKYNNTERKVLYVRIINNRAC